jgi:hypothetical protein
MWSAANIGITLASDEGSKGSGTCYNALGEDKEMSTKRLIEQRSDNRTSNDDLKRSINTLPTSSAKNPAPNPFIVGRKPAQNGNKENQSGKD